MKVTHELTVFGQCPVNGAIDVHQVTVEVHRVLKVEDILAAVQALPVPIFQEDMTQTLAAKLDAQVTSVCFHSGVKTTCTA